jgi:predicted TIM-barrel fold metal-dependent hydrolase
MNGDIPLSNGPHPDPRKPEFKLPPGACDCHCHVFGPSDRFPLSPSRKYTPPDAPKEDLAGLHEVLGIERAVIVQASVQGTDNRAVLDAIASRPDRYRGVAIIEDGLGAEDLAALDAGGIRGARFTILRRLGGAPDFARFERLLGRIAPFGWHADLHAEADDLPPFARLSREMGVPIVIDHMAKVKGEGGADQEQFQTLLDIARDENCWIKVSCPDRGSGMGFPFSDMVAIARALIEAAPDRVLWGTDWPHVNARAKRPPNDGDLVDFLPLYMDAAILQKKTFGRQSRPPLRFRAALR